MWLLLLKSVVVWVGWCMWLCGFMYDWRPAMALAGLGGGLTSQSGGLGSGLGGGGLWNFYYVHHIVRDVCLLLWSLHIL